MTREDTQVQKLDGSCVKSWWSMRDQGQEPGKEVGVSLQADSVEREREASWELEGCVAEQRK